MAGFHNLHHPHAGHNPGCVLDTGPGIGCKRVLHLFRQRQSGVAGHTPTHRHRKALPHGCRHHGKRYSRRQTHLRGPRGHVCEGVAVPCPRPRNGAPGHNLEPPRRRPKLQEGKGHRGAHRRPARDTGGHHLPRGGHRKPHHQCVGGHNVHGCSHDAGGPGGGGNHGRVPQHQGRGQAAGHTPVGGQRKGGCSGHHTQHPQHQTPHTRTPQQVEPFPGGEHARRGGTPSGHHPLDAHVQHPSCQRSPRGAHQRPHRPPGPRRHGVVCAVPGIPRPGCVTGSCPGSPSGGASGRFAGPHAGVYVPGQPRGQRSEPGPHAQAVGGNQVQRTHGGAAGAPHPPQRPGLGPGPHTPRNRLGN